MKYLTFIILLVSFVAKADDMDLVTDSDLSYGLVGRWTMESTNVPNTISGGIVLTNKAWTGTIQPLVSGAIGLAFDRSLTASNYLDGGVNAMNITNLPISFACWFKTSKTADTDEYLINKARSTALTNRLYIGRNTGQSIGMLICSNNSSALISLTNSIAGLTNNVWHHLGVSIHTNKQELYVDGTLVKSSTYALNPVNFSCPSAPFTIGCTTTASLTPSFFWTGSIDDVRAYNIYLSSNSYSLLYNGRHGTQY